MVPRSVSSVIIYVKKFLDSGWEQRSSSVTPVQKMLYQYKLHIEILDYDWLKDNRKLSKPIMSREMMTKILKEKIWKKFSGVKKNDCFKSRMIFFLPTDDAIKELRNGAKKYQDQQKSVEDVVRRKKRNFGNWETRIRWTEQIIREILRRSKKQIFRHFLLANFFIFHY